MEGILKYCVENLYENFLCCFRLVPGMEVKTYAEMNWHSLSIDEVLSILGTSMGGLSSAEALSLIHI